MQKETGGGQSNGLGNLSNPAAQGEELTRAEWVDSASERVDLRSECAGDGLVGWSGQDDLSEG